MPANRRALDERNVCKGFFQQADNRELQWRYPMNFKKILLAVDASENSSRAVKYTGEMIGGAGDFQIEIFYVERLPERDTFPDESSWENACREQKNKVREFLEQAKQTLMDKGVRPEIIIVRYLRSSEFFGSPEDAGFRSAANQIMHAQQEGGFGTLVVGRRGVSKAEEFLFGSVSTKIIHHSKNCSVWVVE
jgi:nucleotide-binding universal stress UspA family protein